jgi:hypothetical protein
MAAFACIATSLGAVLMEGQTLSGRLNANAL